MSLDIKHGAYTRFSAAVSASETIYWTAGRLVKIDTSAQWRVHDGGANNIVCMANNDRVNATTTGPTVTLNKSGAPTGEKKSAIMDQAVCTNDQLQSGVAFNPGDVLYASTTGYVTTSGNGTGSNAPKIGWALDYGNAGDSARPLLMFFVPAPRY